MEMLKNGVLFGLGFAIGTGAVAIGMNAALILIGMLLR